MGKMKPAYLVPLCLETSKIEKIGSTVELKMRIFTQQPLAEEKSNRHQELPLTNMGEEEAFIQ